MNKIPIYKREPNNSDCRIIFGKGSWVEIKQSNQRQAFKRHFKESKINGQDRGTIMGNHSTRTLKVLFMRKHIASPCIFYSQKLKFSSWKRQPKRQGIISPRRQPFPHRVQCTPYLHLYEHIFVIISTEGRAGRQLQKIIVSRSPRVITKLGGNCCAVFDLGMTWKEYDDVGS